MSTEMSKTVSGTVNEVLGSVRNAFSVVEKHFRLKEAPLRVVIGVSGGMDSHVLLNAASCLAKELNLEITVAHVNHQLRAESSEEAKVVLALAAKYDARFLLHEAKKRCTGENLEAWGREVRYEFFEQCRRETESCVVATAHHQLDQAETLLMRTLSGRLATDACSIAFFDERRRVIRPLLYIRKEQISAYAAAKCLEYTEDKSNFDCRRTRNLLRHKILPELEKSVNPRLCQGLALTAERLNADERELWLSAENLISEEPNPRQKKFLELLSPALKWRVLKLLATLDLGELAMRLGYSALRRAAAPNLQKHKIIQLGFGIECFYNASNTMCFCFSPKCSKQVPEGERSPVLPVRSPVLPVRVALSCYKPKEREKLSVPGKVERCLAGGRKVVITAAIIQAENSLKNKRIRESTESAFFDAALVANSTLWVRERKAGDSVRVLGRGARKLKKLFQEQGLKLTERSLIPIVEVNGDILWVPGVASSELAQLTTESTNLLFLSCKGVQHSNID